MAASVGHVLAQLQRWTSPRLEELSDAALLERFIQGRDEPAFAALVGRHGAMVLRCCRRILGDVPEVEDAFQAVFLVLARKAFALKQPDALAGWLHGVARRVALKARTKAAFRAGETQLPEELPDTRGDPLARLTARELLTVLDEEVAHLPKAQRSAVVLCCLEGRTQEEAARLLGWTAGSLKGHLQRGRQRLQERLARRGIVLSAVLALAAVSRGEAATPLLLRSTVTAVLSGGFDTSASALAHSILQAMFLNKLAVALTVALTIALAASATVAVVYRTAVTQIPEDKDNTPVILAASKDAGVDKPQARTDAVGDSLPTGAVARLGTIRLRHAGWVNSVAYSPDGKLLASGGEDERVRLWDAETGKELRQFNLSQKNQGASPVNGVAFSPDGKLLAAGGWGTDLALWDVASGKEIRREQGVTRYVVFSPDSRMVITGGFPNGGAGLLELPSNKRRGLPPGFETIPAVAFSPDGKLLATTRANHRVSLWDVVTWKERRSLRGHENEVRSLDFSPDGKQLVTGGMDKTVRLWDVAGGKEIRRLLTPGLVDGVRYSPDGKTIAVRSDGRAILLWDAQSGKQLRQVVGYGGGFSFPMAFAPDGKKLLSVQGNALQVWETATGKELFPASGIRESIDNLAYGDDGRTLATVSWEGTVRLWDTATNRERHRFGGGQPGIRSVALSSDGRLAATAGNKMTQLWNAATGKQLFRWDTDLNDGFDLAFSPDGRVLASANGDASIQLWWTATGKTLSRLKGHAKGPVYSIAFAPDGKTLASGSLDKTVRLWDWETGKELRVFTGHTGWVNTVAFAPDSRTVASAGDDNDLFIRLWDTKTGQELRRFEAHEPGQNTAIFSIAFSPDGRMLASAGFGETIHLWEVATGKERCRFHGQDYRIEKVAFSPNGRILASNGTDGTVLLWDATGRQLSGRPRRQPLTRDAWETRWNDLADRDAAKAYQAMQVMLGSEQTVSLLRKRLRPAAAVDAARLKRLVVELDSDDFAVREEATRQLAAVGDAAEPVLRKALPKASAEVRKRIEDILVRIDPASSADLLRGLRAVEVLEWLGSVEARQVLKTLAEGDPHARLTREAKAALERLARGRR